MRQLIAVRVSTPYRDKQDVLEQHRNLLALYPQQYCVPVQVCIAEDMGVLLRIKLFSHKKFAEIAGRDDSIGSRKEPLGAELGLMNLSDAYLLNTLA